MSGDRDAYGTPLNDYRRDDGSFVSFSFDQDQDRAPLVDVPWSEQGRRDFIALFQLIGRVALD